MAQNALFLAKKAGIKILVGFLSGLIHLKNFITLILTWTVVKPLWWISKTVLFSFAVKIYKITLFIKIQWWDKIYGPLKIKIIYPLTRRYITHSVIAIITVFSITSNISAKEASLENVEQIGQKSILFTLTYQGDMDNFVQETTEFTKTKTAVNYLSPDVGGLVHLGATTDFSDEEISSISAFYEDNDFLNPNLPSLVLNTSVRSKVVEYVVSEGDTASAISENFGLRLNTVLWANKLTANDMIRPGDKLLILPVDGVMHKVKKGDTIEKIAKYYNSSNEKIMEFNALIDAQDIMVDEYLIVPDGKVPPPPAPAPKPVSRLATKNIFTIPPSSSASPGKKGMVWPTSGKVITQYFNWRHFGLDVDGDFTSPIYAAESGTVLYAGWGRGYGWYIKLSHGNGVETLYAHLSKMLVGQGDSVSRGQTIGIMGSTGWSTGSHLHFEVIIGGKKVNPLDYL